MRKHDKINSRRFDCESREIRKNQHKKWQRKETLFHWQVFIQLLKSDTKNNQFNQIISKMRADLKAEISENYLQIECSESIIDSLILDAFRLPFDWPFEGQRLIFRQSFPPSPLYESWSWGRVDHKFWRKNATQVAPNFSFLLADFKDKHNKCAD